MKECDPKSCETCPSKGKGTKSKSQNGFLQGVVISAYQCGSPDRMSKPTHDLNTMQISTRSFLHTVCSFQVKLITTTSGQL